MTVAEVQELFAYNAWANRRLFAALEPLPAESYFRDLKSSQRAGRRSKRSATRSWRGSSNGAWRRPWR